MKKTPFLVSIYSIILFGGLLLLLITWSCNRNKKKLDPKGFAVSQTEEDSDKKKVSGLKQDSLKFETRPKNVLLTGHPQHRLIPIYKVNYHKKTKKPFTGSNNFYTSYYSERANSDGNQWNNHLMPGLEIVSGYNLVNFSHFNHETQKEQLFFKKPVLVRNIYYPSFSQDTLNYQPVLRDYYMISVYDEDTNKDGYINLKDLRRFYYFDIYGNNQQSIVPKNYAVMSSEYDAANDFMYVFAKLDENGNGIAENKEPTHAFWVDLKNPQRKGVQYSRE